MRETWEVAKGVGAVKKAGSSTIEDLSREQERVSGGESQAKRLSLSLSSVALLDSAKVHLSHVQSGGEITDN